MYRLLVRQAPSAQIALKVMCAHDWDFPPINAVIHCKKKKIFFIFLLIWTNVGRHRQIPRSERVFSGHFRRNPVLPIRHGQRHEGSKRLVGGYCMSWTCICGGAHWYAYHVYVVCFSFFFLLLRHQSFLLTFGSGIDLRARWLAKLPSPKFSHSQSRCWYAARPAKRMPKSRIPASCWSCSRKWLGKSSLHRWSVTTSISSTSRVDLAFV